MNKTISTSTSATLEKTLTPPGYTVEFSKNKEQSGEPKLFDWGKSKFASKHEVVKRGKEVEVKLEPLKLGKDEQLKVIVLPPTRPGQPEKPEIEPKVKKSGKTYEIAFKPVDVGTHKVIASVGEQQHPNSPFPIRVYDAAEIIVGEIAKKGKVNESIEFSVDAGNAGFGNLEIAIKDHDGVIIPSHVTQMDNTSAKFLVTFTPTKSGMHTVNITFNKEVLKSSPFEVEVIEDAPPPSLQHEGSTIKSKRESSRIEKEEKKREKEEKALQALLKKKELKR